MDQLVLVILTHITKQVILGIGCVPFNVFQVHTQHVVRSGGESCPVPTKIPFSDHQSHICSLFSSGKNQPSRSVFSRTQSTLHRLSFGHRIHHQKAGKLSGLMVYSPSVGLSVDF